MLKDSVEYVLWSQRKLLHEHQEKCWSGMRRQGMSVLFKSVMNLYM